MTTLEKILFLINKNGLTEIEFTEKIGLNKTAVTEWKNGKTKSYKKHIQKIAAILNVTEEYLLLDENETSNIEGDTTDEKLLLNAYRLANDSNKLIILQKAIQLSNQL